MILADSAKVSATAQILAPVIVSAHPVRLSDALTLTFDILQKFSIKVLTNRYRGGGRLSTVNILGGKGKI